MTGILPFAEWLEELEELIAQKENPDEWYILMGEHVGEYSINDADKPEELAADETVPQEYQRDANGNVDGFYQIGTFGWSDKAFDSDVEFVAETGFSETHEPIDRRLNGLLLVHESVLSDEATEKAAEATA